MPEEKRGRFRGVLMKPNRPRHAELVATLSHWLPAGQTPRGRQHGLGRGGG